MNNVGNKTIRMFGEVGVALLLFWHLLSYCGHVFFDARLPYLFYLIASLSIWTYLIVPFVLLGKAGYPKACSLFGVLGVALMNTIGIVSLIIYLGDYHDFWHITGCKVLMSSIRVSAYVLLGCAFLKFPPCIKRSLRVVTAIAFFVAAGFCQLWGVLELLDVMGDFMMYLQWSGYLYIYKLTNMVVFNVGWVLALICFHSVRSSKPKKVWRADDLKAGRHTCAQACASAASEPPADAIHPFGDRRSEMRSSDSIDEKLEIIQRLYAKGVITSEEYGKKRKELIASI